MHCQLAERVRYSTFEMNTAPPAKGYRFGWGKL